MSGATAHRAGAPAPDPGAEGHSALHGGAHDAGKRQGGLGDWVRSARADGVGLEVAATQEPP